MLVWVGQHPVSFFASALIILAAYIALAVWPRPSARLSEGAVDIVYCLTMTVVLFAWRWPVFISPNPLNADEGQMVANALKATIDLVPWRGFDGTTSGPLNSDVLALAALVGAHIDFFSARVIGLLMIAGALCALYFAIRWTFDARIARLSLVPPVVMFAFVRDLDFVHYSSEHLPIFLTTVALACAAYIAGSRGTAQRRVWAAAVAGLCIGCTGFAKLQAIPIALIVFLYAVAAIMLTRSTPGARSRNEAVAVFAGMALPFVIILGAVVATGEWNDFVTSYLRFAAAYVDAKGRVGIGFFFGGIAQYATFLTSALVVAVAGVTILVARRVRIGPAARVAALSSIALLAAAVFAIYEAHRGFPHYLLLSVVPIAWCTANLLGAVETAVPAGRSRVALHAAYVVLFVVPALRQLALTPDFFMKDLPVSAHWPQNPVSIAMERYVPRGASVAVWGWMPQYYVETGTIMATRDAHTHHQIEPGPLQSYFRDRFMNDLASHPPPLIVDAVAPGSFGYTNNVAQGIDSFAALASFVRTRYVLAEDVGGVRIFRMRRSQ